VKERQGRRRKEGSEEEGREGKRGGRKRKGEGSKEKVKEGAPQIFTCIDTLLLKSIDFQITLNCFYRATQLC